VREALSVALPQITSSLGYTRRFSSVYQAAPSDSIFGPLLQNTPFAAANLWSVDFNASQLLFSRQLGAAVGAARAYRQASEAQRRETLAQVAFDVRRAYFEAAYADHVVRIAEEGLSQASAHLADVERWQQQGARAEYDLIRARVDAMNQEPEVVGARNARETALLELRRVLDLPLDRPVALTTPLEFSGDAVPVVDLDALPAPRRAAQDQARANVEVQRNARSVETGARWPSLKASAGISQQAFPGDIIPSQAQFRHDVSATIKIEMPIFTGFRSEGAIERATAELRRAELERDKTDKAARLDFERARNEVRRSLAQLVARNGAAQLAQRAYHIATVRYSSGISTQLEVSDARLQLQTSQVHEVEAAKDYRVALAGLERAVGMPLSFESKPLDQISVRLPEVTRP